MANGKNNPTSVSLSPAAERVLEFVRKQQPVQTSRSRVIQAILLGTINLNDYDIPADIREEISRELNRG